MEIGAMLGDAFAYTKEALVGNWVRWLILLVGTIVFPIILGILLLDRGERTPPDPGLGRSSSTGSVFASGRFTRSR